MMKHDILKKPPKIKKFTLLKVNNYKDKYKIKDILAHGRIDLHGSPEEAI